MCYPPTLQMKERSLYLHGLTVGPDVGRGPVG